MSVAVNPQRRNAIVTAVVLAAMAVGVYVVVVLQFMAH